MAEENMLGMIFAIYNNNSENCIHSEQVLYYRYYCHSELKMTT